MPDKYTKVLEIKTDVDKKAYDAFKKKVESDAKTMSVLTKKELAELNVAKQKAQSDLDKMRKLKQQIADVDIYGGKNRKKQLKALKKELKELQAKSLVDENGDKKKSPMSQAISLAKDSATNMFKSALKAGFGSSDVKQVVTNLFKDAIDELNKMAGSNFATTLFQNKDLMDMSLTYGLSGGQAYALDKALSFFDKSSIEETYLMGSTAKQKFNEKINKYLDKYNQLNDAGFFKEWDNFRYEFKTFKEDLTYEIMQWIMDNKELIKAGFKGLIELMKVAVNVLSWIANRMGVARTQSEIDAKTSDIISHYSTSSNTNNKVSINNTFNGVNTSNRQSYVNAGELTYKQFLAALEGF